MKKNLLNEYLAARLISAERNLSAYTRNLKPIGLHRLRVEIKKIKAMVYFAEKLSDKKFDLAGLKSLFAQAGQIRTIQMNISLLSRLDAPGGIIVQLQKKEQSLVQRFIRHELRHKTILQEFCKKKWMPEILQSKKEIIKCFKKEKQKATKIIVEKDRESMHRYRGKIKKLMYIYNVLPYKIQNGIQWDAAEIKNQDKKLGNWHDMYCLTLFLSQRKQMKTSEYFFKAKQKEEKLFNALLA